MITNSSHSFFVIMFSKVSGTLYFSPNLLPAQPGQTPLSIAQFLLVDNDNKRLEVLQILGFPQGSQPGKYDVEVDIRPKKEGTGFSTWHRNSQKVG